MQRTKRRADRQTDISSRIGTHVRMRIDGSGFADDLPCILGLVHLRTCIGHGPSGSQAGYGACSGIRQHGVVYGLISMLVAVAMALPIAVEVALRVSRRRSLALHRVVCLRLSVWRCVLGFSQAPMKGKNKEREGKGEKRGFHGPLMCCFLWMK
jgi:hypothetical protein